MSAYYVYNEDNKNRPEWRFQPVVLKYADSLDRNKYDVEKVYYPSNEDYRIKVKLKNKIDGPTAEYSFNKNRWKYVGKLSDSQALALNRLVADTQEAINTGDSVLDRYK